MRGFYLTRTLQAIEVIDAVRHPNLQLHLDLYHLQLTEGQLANTLRRYMPRIRHLQIAGVPGRNEPSLGEINYPFLFDLIDQLGFDGWIGCEYRPAGNTIEGLAWAKRYGIKSSPNRSIDE
jgi:hydroxypyruvate isomerase